LIIAGRNLTLSPHVRPDRSSVVAVPSSRGFALGCFAACLAFAPLPASAQGEAETAAARALFAEGRALADAEQWDQAADRFRRALALRPSVSIRYNLAVALERQGKLVEAAEQLRTTLRDAPEGDRTRGPAETLLRGVEPRIGRLEVRVEGDASGVEVSLDGRVLSSALVGVAVPTDPGHHIVVARRGGLETTAEVDVPEGQGATVSVAAPTAAAPAPPDPVPPPTDPTPPPVPDPSTTVETPPGGEGGTNWTYVVIGGVAVGAGIAVDLVPASSSNQKFDGLDLVPVGLYVAGAALVALGVL
jgi:hypothetical protein